MNTFGRTPAPKGGGHGATVSRPADPTAGRRPGPARPPAGCPPPPGSVPATVRRRPALGRATDQRPPVRPGTAVRPGQQGRGVDRLPARPRPPGTPEVHRPGGVGPPTPVGRAGAAGGGRAG